MNGDELRGLCFEAKKGVCHLEALSRVTATSSELQRIQKPTSALAALGGWRSVETRKTRRLGSNDVWPGSTRCVAMHEVQALQCTCKVQASVLRKENGKPVFEVISMFYGFLGLSMFFYGFL